MALRSIGFFRVLLRITPMRDTSAKLPSSPRRRGPSDVRRYDTNGMVAPYSIRHQSATVEIVECPLTREEATAMKTTTIGIDLAKTVFQVHGVDERGKVVLKKQLKRVQVLPFFANLAPCLIGMEACASAHYWARK